MTDSGGGHSGDLRLVARPWPFSDFVYQVADSAASPHGASPGNAPTCIHFSGLGLFGSEVLATAEGLTTLLRTGRLTIADVLSGTGYFTAILSTGDEVLFVTDLLGFEHLYVHDGPRGWTISNRLHALVEHLRAENTARKLNVNYAAMVLWSKHAFLRQCHAHGLAIEGLSLVPMDCYLVVSRGRIEYRKKPVLAEVFGGVQDSYETLIEAAADQIARSISAIRSSSLFDDVSTDLSGGRDSRVVFGALVHLGVATEVPTVTRDLPGTRDLKCALRIVETYKAPFHTGDPEAPWMFAETPEDALCQWRSYYMGMYHKMSLTPWSVRGAYRRSIRLTGSSGGIYRSVWSNWLSRSLSETAPGETLDALFERMFPQYPTQHRRGAAEALSDCILSLPGRSALEKFDNHYLYFRNRMHFGMRAQRTQVSGLTWSPLVCPALLLASRKLDWEQRRTGKAVFDVQDRLAPELNFFKYEGDPWPAEFLAGSRWKGDRKPGRTIDLDDVERRWQEAQAKLASAAASRRDKAARPFTSAEARVVARARTAESLERLMASSEELSAILGPRFIADTMDQFDRANDKHWLLLTSKITSLSDLVLG